MNAGDCFKKLDWERQEKDEVAACYQGWQTLDHVYMLNERMVITQYDFCFWIKTFAFHYKDNVLCVGFISSEYISTRNLGMEKNLIFITKH